MNKKELEKRNEELIAEVTKLTNETEELEFYKGRCTNLTGALDARDAKIKDLEQCLKSTDKQRALLSKATDAQIEKLTSERDGFKVLSKVMGKRASYALDRVRKEVEHSCGLEANIDLDMFGGGEK